MKYQIRDFVLERLHESSTYQAIGFMLTFFGMREFTENDLVNATAIGALVSAIIKLLIPDKVFVDATK